MTEPEQPSQGTLTEVPLAVPAGRVVIPIPPHVVTSKVGQVKQSATQVLISSPVAAQHKPSPQLKPATQSQELVASSPVLAQQSPSPVVNTLTQSQQLVLVSALEQQIPSPHPAPQSWQQFVEFSPQGASQKVSPQLAQSAQQFVRSSPPAAQQTVSPQAGVP
ncbi:MAG TPA: hypothetical protein VI749_08755 [Candidatus Omnitrophota bacterium]|nr:hypothetical protein [Candidatus Omnitrophota bacterium]